MADVVPLTEAHCEALLRFFAELPEGDRTFIREDVTDPDVVRGWSAGSPGVDRRVAVDGDRVLGYVAVLRLPGWSDHVGEVRLVVAPAVPAVPAGIAAHLHTGTTVAVRPGMGAPGPGRFSPALLTAAVDAGAAVCPVAFRWRGAASPPPAGRSTVAVMRWLAASPGAVIEVHLLPALSPAGATAQELATAAEYAVAAVLEPTALM